jgi:hypothetical protein
MTEGVSPAIADGVSPAIALGVSPAATGTVLVAAAGGVAVASPPQADRTMDAARSSGVIAESFFIHDLLEITAIGLLTPLMFAWTGYNAAIA